ncbi:MAG: HDIG domain-containing protein [Methanimicrococcus sp.]|nr:HDIG domain-containing protein [Methanimicrococcus sp.]
MISKEEAVSILRAEGCDDKVISHCLLVSQVAVKLAEKNKAMGRDVDIALAEIGGILHDLGRARTHDMDHAIIGVTLAEKHGVDKPVLEIIKKHIGAGLTPEEADYFGLPKDDYMPRTWEEKIVAHADNLVKGTQVITLKKRNKILKERGADKEQRQRIKDLANEVDPNESDEPDDFDDETL